MALIKCPECGKEISDTCDVCIHCGYKFKKESTDKPPVRRRRKGWLVPVIIGGVITALVIGSPLIYLIWYFANK